MIYLLQMSFLETLEGIRSAKQFASEERQKEAQALTVSKQKRLKELKGREGFLVEEAAKTLCPTLDSLNRVFYKRRGKIILTPLSAEKAPLGIPPRFLINYSPYLYGQGEVRVEVQIDLFPPNTEDPVCTLNVWEPSKTGWYDLRVSLIKAGAEEYEFFDFRKEGELPKIEAFIAERVKVNPYF